MSNRATATRYARALFDVMIAEGDPVVAERELTEFVGLVSGHAALKQVLENPAVPSTRKRAIVDDLLRQASYRSPVLKVLGLLADRDRLRLLSEILEAYRQRLLDHQRVVRAEITTAIPLPADRLSALEQAVGQATGRQVRVSARVDASILGGVVTRVGSVVYDGSIVRQLERVKQQLVEQR